MIKDLYIIYVGLKPDLAKSWYKLLHFLFYIFQDGKAWSPQFG
jgi:hypothetical protein